MANSESILELLHPIQSKIMKHTMQVNVKKKRSICKHFVLQGNLINTKKEKKLLWNPDTWKLMNILSLEC